jgi:hypothetical protein
MLLFPYVWCSYTHHCSGALRLPRPALAATSLPPPVLPLPPLPCLLLRVLLRLGGLLLRQVPLLRAVQADGLAHGALRQHQQEEQQQQGDEPGGEQLVAQHACVHHAHCLSEQWSLGPS